jgi:alpha-D-ribose 1-methylphosphonate 5-triphosphate synthase subunit PhnH
MNATSTLARMGAGFADPTHGAQQTFRVLLDAMSLPGRLRTLPDAATAGLATAQADMAPPVGIGMAATLLTLLDADTPVLLAGALADEGTRAWIRFHTSARPATIVDTPTIAAALARDVTPALWEQLALGSDEAPQDGATLIVEVDGLADRQGADTPSGIALTLHGPGIETTQALVVRGLPDAFWRWRQELATAMPRGVDLLLVHGTTLAAIPRSSHLSRKD